MISPHTLLQEELNKDPWKIFVCCIFCNLTKRFKAEPFFWKVLKLYPTPESLATACNNKLSVLIQGIGLSKKRSKALIQMSCDYINKDWKDNPTTLYGIGKYGSDAYYLFCTDEWERVRPKDYALKLYQEWLFKEKTSEYICT